MLDQAHLQEVLAPERLIHCASEKLQNCILTNPMGLFTLNIDGRIEKINTRAAQIFGFASPDEAKGTPLSQLELFFSQPVVEMINRLLTEGDAFRIERLPGTNLIGHFGYYCLSCNRVLNRGHESTAVLGVIEDVSEQAKQQQELQSRVEELSTLSQISRVVSSTLDTEEILRIILTGVTARQGLGFNRAFLFLLDDTSHILKGCMALGPADAEEAGRIWSSLEHDSRSLSEILSLYREESGRTSRSLTDLIADTRIDTNDGSLFARAVQNKAPMVIEYDTPLDSVTSMILQQLGERQVATTPLVFHDRPLGLLVVDNAITHRQITEHDLKFLKLIADQAAAAIERSYLYRDIKQHATDLEEINRKLAETQNQIIMAEKMSVIGELTSAVAHELRNPLTIIGGFANLMHKNLEPGSPDAEYLNIIISETQRAEAVLADVLDFSKASKVQSKQLDLNELVRSALDMLTARMGEASCRVQMKMSGNALPLWGNPDQLLHAFHQILLSLLQDLVNVVPVVTTYSQSDKVRMEVSFLNADSHQSKIEKNLKQYFGGNSTKRLSLIVAEETLKHHGGGLGVESNPGKGPVLYVELPLQKEIKDAQNSGG